jgi:hypothetical protein
VIRTSADRHMVADGFTYTCSRRNRMNGLTAGPTHRSMPNLRVAQREFAPNKALSSWILKSQVATATAREVLHSLDARAATHDTAFTGF